MQRLASRAALPRSGVKTACDNNILDNQDDTLLIPSPHAAWHLLLDADRNRRFLTRHSTRHAHLGLCSLQGPQHWAELLRSLFRSRSTAGNCSIGTTHYLIKVLPVRRWDRLTSTYSTCPFSILQVTLLLQQASKRLFTVVRMLPGLPGSS